MERHVNTFNSSYAVSLPLLIPYPGVSLSSSKELELDVEAFSRSMGGFLEQMLSVDSAQSAARLFSYLSSDAQKREDDQIIAMNIYLMFLNYFL
jgi:hypothetical protein